MTDTAILVPLSDHLDGYRLAAWRHVHARLGAAYPIHTGTVPADHWSKGTALALARDTTTADVLVIHDADVLVAQDALEDAIDAVRGGAPWAIPHDKVLRLTALATIAACAGGTTVDDAALERPPYTGYSGGGITVVSAGVWDTAPVDPRFTGWGNEDEAWGWALGCLYGHPWRGTAPLIHFYHPHAAPGARRGTNAESHLLWRAYRAHRSRPDLMRGILAEAHG